MADAKWSHFPSESPDNADEIVGLHSGHNARFSVANFILAVRQGVAALFVPLTRKVNNKELSSDITLTASDVGAQPTITASGILKGDGAGGVSAATSGTDYQAPLTAGTDYATPAQLVDKANQAQLAYVETGTTASRAYVVGEYFCWNGLLYRVTTAISSGGTFTPGTNCELRTNGGFNDMAFSGTVTTGSLHDITRSGIYYLGGAVTDKPSQYGGMYIVAVYSTLIVGLFIDVVYGSTYSINYFNGTWYSHQL